MLAGRIADRVDFKKSGIFNVFLFHGLTVYWLSSSSLDNEKQQLIQNAKRLRLRFLGLPNHAVICTVHAQEIDNRIC